MISPKHLSGAVLAGGQSRRLRELGAINKGLLKLGGKPLVAHALTKLSPYVSQVVISANEQTDEYARYATVLGDDPSVSGWQGPLAGVLTALEHIQTPWLLCLPVDCPFLPELLVPELLKASAGQQSVQAFYARAERAHPLCLLLHQDLTANLRLFLNSGERRVQGWLQQAGAQAVEFGVHTEPLFSNINTPEQWREAQALFVKTP